jgi:hypothetical protein
VIGVVRGVRHGSEYVSHAIAEIEIIDRRMAVQKRKQTYMGREDTEANQGHVLTR